MRTTIDLPDDLHGVVREMAHRDRKSISEVVAELIRRALMPQSGRQIQINESGLPSVSVGRLISDSDVRSLEDDW